MKKLSENEWRATNDAVGFLDPIKLQWHHVPLKARPFGLDQPVTYITKAGAEITVPKGFRTDFASIPRFFWRLISPIGRHGAAAFIHDWLCDVKPKPYGYGKAADIFGEAMELLEVPHWKRTVMVWAVKIAGPKFRKSKRNNLISP